MEPNKVKSEESNNTEDTGVKANKKWYQRVWVWLALAAVFIASKFKKNKPWYKRVWVWIIFSVVLVMGIIKAENIISPLVLVAGLMMVVAGFLGMCEIAGDQAPEHQQANGIRLKHTKSILIIGIVISVLGLATFSVGGTGTGTRKIVEEERVVSNVSIVGIDSNSSPLAASDMKLLRKAEKSGSNTYITYTVVGNLEKISTVPEESYFRYKIILVDKNGKYISSRDMDTKPNPLGDGEKLMTCGSSFHLESEFLSSVPDNDVVSVEFTDITEIDKNSYISEVLSTAREHMNDESYYYAKRYAESVLSYDPNNKESEDMLEQIELLESVEEETNEQKTDAEVEGASSKEVYDWKQFIQDYENWMNRYIDFMKKYNANPTDMSLLADYLSLVSEMSEWSEKADDIRSELEDFPEALREYNAALLRIAQKLNEIQ